MMACICGGVLEYTAIAVVVSAVSCVWCLIRRCGKRKKDCECKCHEEATK